MKKPHIKLTVIIKEEDGWWIATCPVLPGCISQGKSKDEAIKNIQEAVVGWLLVKDEIAIQAAQSGSEEPGQTLALSF